MASSVPSVVATSVFVENRGRRRATFDAKYWKGRRGTDCGVLEDEKSAFLGCKKGSNEHKKPRIAPQKRGAWVCRLGAAR